MIRCGIDYTGTRFNLVWGVNYFEKIPYYFFMKKSKKVENPEQRTIVERSNPPSDFLPNHTISSTYPLGWNQLCLQKIAEFSKIWLNNDQKTVLMIWNHNIWYDFYWENIILAIKGCSGSKKNQRSTKKSNTCTRNTEKKKETTINWNDNWRNVPMITCN